MTDIITIPMEPVVETSIKENKVRKQYKTFKEYYSDPDFKKKHLEYINTKIKCPVCRCKITRSHMTRHKRTKRCKANKIVQEKEEEKLSKLEILKILQKMMD